MFFSRRWMLCSRNRNGDAACLNCYTFGAGEFHRILVGGSKNLLPKAHLLPLSLVSFIGSLAEAAKSCFWGEIAAFGRGRFHQVFVGGSKNLLPEAHLLPLTMGGFIGSLAEAAKTCFRGVFAAFDLGEFHRVFGRGSKILLLRRDCCLWAWSVSSGLRRRQKNLDLRLLIHVVQ